MTLAAWSTWTLSATVGRNSRRSATVAAIVFSFLSTLAFAANIVIYSECGIFLTSQRIDGLVPGCRGIRAGWMKKLPIWPASLAEVITISTWLWHNSTMPYVASLLVFYCILFWCWLSFSSVFLWPLQSRQNVANREDTAPPVYSNPDIGVATVATVAKGITMTRSTTRKIASTITLFVGANLSTFSAQAESLW